MLWQSSAAAECGAIRIILIPTETEAASQFIMWHELIVNNMNSVNFTMLLTRKSNKTDIQKQITKLLVCRSGTMWQKQSVCCHM